MDAGVKHVLFATFILSIFWESSESYNLNHNIPAKYDNITADLVRLRRQSPVQACRGDVSKFQCTSTTDCISSELECDGRADCPDGSDEMESLCIPKKCTTPAQPAHGKWINLLNDGQDIFTSQIDGNSVIKYTCNPGYKLSATVEDSILVHCRRTGKWSLAVLPTCQKLCPSLYNSPLITLTCKIDGSSVRCDKATDNTIVTYECAPYYEAPYGRFKSSSCYDGFWDYIPECVPVCGEKRVSATPLIVNGRQVERGHYPWAVALYRNKDSDPLFTNICGGSLLSTELVLTAAHCVSQKETGNTYDAKYFRVAAGKYYINYDDPRDSDTAQYAEVAIIETHRDYKGEIQNFRADIALLKLKTSLVLSQVVQPVCYNNLPTIEPNTVGLVTGWGYTISSGEPSETLKELELPYNADEQCLKNLDRDFSSRYFISDKLCAGFNDQNTSVCNGDSGGGLVFRNPYFKRRYFIHGIVSLAHSYRENQRIHCNIQRSPLFTKVENYIEWIQLKVRHWTRTRNNAKKCRAPAQPNHGRWLYLNSGNKDASNQEVDANIAIVFFCHQGYQLSSTIIEDGISMVCLPTGQWNVTVMPVCQRLCPSVYDGPGITVSCTKNGSSIPCDKATDDTVLAYKCAPYYEPVYGRDFSSTCYDGFWHYNPICNPVCGEKTVGESDGKKGDYPWVVALYRNTDSDTNFTNICGGSLITPEIVLTAANCVSEPNTGEILPARYFRVGADVYYSQYIKQVLEDSNTPYSKVTRIERAGAYRKESRGDIALLELGTSLTLSKFVQPVCYQDLPPLYPGKPGEVSKRRFSTSSGQPSESLKELDIIYSRQEECVKKLDDEFTLISNIDDIFETTGTDKICVEFKEINTKVCRGDSGEGVVFNSYYRYSKSRYYIYGVTGFGQSYINGNDCNIQNATLYTKVSNYIDWIQFTVKQWTTERIGNATGKGGRRPPPSTGLTTSTTPVPPSPVVRNQVDLEDLDQPVWVR